MADFALKRGSHYRRTFGNACSLITTPRQGFSRGYPLPSTYAAEGHDLKYGIRDKELATGSIVLLHDTKREKDKSRNFQMAGPYRICGAVKEKGTYLLEILDGSRLAGTFAGGRVNKFHPRQEFRLTHVPD